MERVQYTARNAGQIVVCGNVTSVNLAPAWTGAVADVSVYNRSLCRHSLKDVHAYDCDRLSMHNNGTGNV